MLNLRNPHSIEEYDAVLIPSSHVPQGVERDGVLFPTLNLLLRVHIVGEDFPQIA